MCIVICALSLYSPYIPVLCPLNSSSANPSNRNLWLPVSKVTVPFLCFSSLEHTQESESWHENRAFVIPISLFFFSWEANSCDDYCSVPINNFSYILLFSIFIQQDDKPLSINVLSFDKASWLPSIWYAKYIVLIFKHSFLSQHCIQAACSLYYWLGSLFHFYFLLKAICPFREQTA